MTKKKNNIISIVGRDLSVNFLKKPKEFNPLDPLTGDVLMGSYGKPLVFSIYSVKSPVVINLIHEFKREKPEDELDDLNIMVMATENIIGGIELNGEPVLKDNLIDFYRECRDNEGYQWIFNQVYKEILMGDFSPKK